MGTQHDRATLTVQKENNPTTREVNHWDGDRCYCAYHRSGTHNTTNYKSFEGEREIAVYPAPRYHVGRQEEREQSRGRFARPRRSEIPRRWAEWEPQRNCSRSLPRKNVSMGEIQTIAEGFVGGEPISSDRKAHARRARFEEVYSTKHCPTKQRNSEPAPTVTFEEADKDGVIYPHDDALLVIMQVVNFTTRRILIDKGSSVEILFWNSFSQMGIDPDCLQPAPMPLKAFKGTWFSQ